MCENREPINDIEAIRDELSALIRLSNEKLDEMKEIQSRIDSVTSEIARLTKELEDLDEADDYGAPAERDGNSAQDGRLGRDGR
jgi:chromosome segregation ATPase